MNLSSVEWFTLSRHFMMILRKASSGKSEKLLAMLNMLGVGIETLKPTLTGLAFEMLPVSERSMLLESVWQIIQAEADRYLDAVSCSFLAKSSLGNGRHPVPSCIERICHAGLNPGVHHRRKKRVVIRKNRSKQAVLRMWARLQRKTQVSTK
jgi:hypothetical protein